MSVSISTANRQALLDPLDPPERETDDSYKPPRDWNRVYINYPEHSNPKCGELYFGFTNAGKPYSYKNNSKVSLRYAHNLFEPMLTS